MGARSVSLGKHLRLLCRQLNISQKELSERSGISQSHLSQVYTGKRQLSVDALFAVAEALNVSVSVLLQEEMFEGGAVSGQSQVTKNWEGFVRALVAWEPDLALLLSDARERCAELGEDQKASLALGLRYVLTQAGFAKKSR